MSNMIRGGLVAILVSIWPGAARALPPNFHDTVLVGGWNQAVGLTFAPDGRMFVWEKGGRVWIVEGGVSAPAPLVDISEEVGDWGDYGMLGFAIDPDFYNNGYVYLLYAVDYHHLIHFGTPSYDPSSNQYFRDTIARVTRYACDPADGFRSVDYSSRLVLIGESMSTGIPLCNLSHGIGTVIFGEDGTLLVGCGDAADFDQVDVGGPTGGSSNTCLSDGIITPQADVGAYRAQLVDSLNGKILRIDPATGDGVPSNPFYDASEPRSARSRVWALGLRNPFRFTVRRGSGQTDPSAGDPGTLYIGDVGWKDWEELNVCKSGGANFGWPAFEGMEAHGGYFISDVSNLDAPNPAYGVAGCTQEYFYFRDLILQDTLNPNPFFPNPCDPAQEVPSTLNRFIHRRPAIDWGHDVDAGPSRTGVYIGQDAAVVNIGDAGSPVQGPQFGGCSSTGGVWYTATDFPPAYQNAYYQADFVGGWIRQFIFDANDNPVEVRDFAQAAEAVVALASDPVGGGIYYLNYGFDGSSAVRTIRWAENLPPVAVGQAAPFYGPAPLAVQFTGSGSLDPDQGGGPGLRYAWDFGDGTPVSREADPVHIYPTEDITNLGTFVGRIFSLEPPRPTGGGNWDPEVMRDGDYPPVGHEDSERQYDTFHQGNPDNIDWIGYSASQPRTLVGLVFQEGEHFEDGGWFDTLRVQVLQNLVWSDVTGLVMTPAYPGNNGLSYETFEVRFDSVSADAIRIYGEPGGSADFISVGELRVLADPLVPVTQPTRYDVTLTVTDALDASSSTTLLVSLNNTPPVVNITSPPDGSTYPLTGDTIVPLTADIFDAEHDLTDLTCRWQTILHHDVHTHPGPFDSNCATETEISPHGGAGATYYYEMALTVSDPAGLVTSTSAFVYPENLFGDFDSDRDVDLTDFAVFQGCFDGDPMNVPVCALADAERDGDIDLADYAVFRNELTGPF